MAERVLVGFSGGVDSAMAVLLLRERGYDVAAVMMSVRDPSGHGCGVTEDVGAARALAGHIGVPLTIVDCSAPYRELVLDYFRNEYLAGRTPNPCVRCNPLLKFSLLPGLARQGGADFDFFATGHYARIEYRRDPGRYVLLRGQDHAKDQSYFLYRLGTDILARTLFPMGELRKQEVRRMAADRRLPVHDKPDSQDFYVGDHADLLGTTAREGNIVDCSGKVLGKHAGYWNFTPGQRKGLRVAFTEPLYVVRVVPERNEVVVGRRDEQRADGCLVGDLVFPDPLPTPGAVLRGKIRSAQPLRAMTVDGTENGTLCVRFAEPLHGVAPGQSLVLYDGDMVVGGGIISQRI